MATNAKHGRIRKLGRHRTWIFRVLRQRSMASLAGNIGVLAFALRVRLVGVAGLAHLMPREFHGPGADIVHRAWPEVPVLAEVAGHNRVPDQQERGCA